MCITLGLASAGGEAHLATIETVDFGGYYRVLDQAEVAMTSCSATWPPRPRSCTGITEVAEVIELLLKLGELELDGANPTQDLVQPYSE